VGTTVSCALPWAFACPLSWPVYCGRASHALDFHATGKVKSPWRASVCARGLHRWALEGFADSDLVAMNRL